MTSVKRFEIFRMLFAVLIALMASFILIFCVSEQPFEAIGYLLLGPLRNRRSIGNVIESMIPLIFTGTGVCIMFSANQINLATEGGFHIGGLMAAVVMLKLGLPNGVNVVFSILAASVAGAVFCVIPAVMKIKTNASELVSSLMLNYISLWIGTFTLMHFILDPAIGSASYEIPTELPVLISKTNIHIGLILALIVAAAGYIFLYKTKMGYELRITGENERFARYSGIDIIKVILISQLAGGMIAGIGGSVELLSPIYARFTWTALLGYGWDAIIICTLAKKNPLYTPLAALFLAYLRTGASIMGRYTDVTLEIVQITQGIIILLVVAKQFLNGTMHRLIAKEAKESLDKEVV